MTGTGPMPTLRERRAVLLEDPELTGRALAIRLAAATDEWLAAVFVDAVGGGPVHDVALLAVGGYGRSELAPGSDLDLVLVHRRRADVGRLAAAIWYPIWDQGVSLDHSVRTASEVGMAMDADLRVALGLLDARTIAGSAALGTEIAAAAADKWRGRSERWLPQVAEAIRKRHREAGDLAFLLEPDLKEARGGLRDLALLAGLRRVVPELTDLVADATLDAAGDTLASARVELQRSTARPTNRLALQDQDTVAAALGCDADTLMAAVADAARAVAWAGDAAWRRIGRALDSRRGRRRAWVPDPIEPGIVVRDGEVTLAFGADPGSDPALALRLAAASAELDLPLAPETLAALAESAPAPPDVWPDELLRALLRLLGAGAPAIAAWESLDQQGVVVRLLPEWAAVRNKPQRNAYHRYTVDRHLLETAANAASLARRVPRPDLLVLAGLLHDLGKGYPGDHTTIGVELVRRLGPRLGLCDADVEVLATLVGLHLLLPEVATRRDLDDPDTIAAVAKAVDDRDTLALLGALVEADSLATGPAAWGSWKASLIARLVERVEAVLDGHPPPAPPLPTPAERRLLDAGRLAVVADGTELTVVAPDRPGLLAVVAGVLAVNGASVLRAATRTEPGPDLARGSERMALIVLSLAPSIEVLPSAERVRADLAAALDGQLDLARLLAELEARRPRPRPSSAGRGCAGVVVTADLSASSSAAVLEVRAGERPGTLWRIAAAIGRAGLVINAAIVATLGAEVVDTFYVTGTDGAKPAADDPRLDRLTRELQTSFEHDR
jgi:[protein-PII] uridylyltransferase